jgi:hypothetical protein
LADFLADAFASLFLVEVLGVFGLEADFAAGSFFCADFFTEALAALGLTSFLSLLADLTDLCEATG